MTLRLQNKTALVTGATSNLGRAIALAYGAEGAHVVVSGRDHERGDAVVREIRAGGGRAGFVAADLDGTADASRALAEQLRGDAHSALTAFGPRAQRLAQLADLVVDRAN